MNPVCQTWCENALRLRFESPILCLYHLSSCEIPQRAELPKSGTRLFIDCEGSSHFMDDLWPRPWLLAQACSCGESWHSFLVGQGTFTRHCKECITICNDRTTDGCNPADTVKQSIIIFKYVELLQMYLIGFWAIKFHCVMRFWCFDGQNTGMLSVQAGAHMMLG